MRQVSIADMTFNWVKGRRDRRWPHATPPHGRERRRRPPGEAAPRGPGQLGGVRFVSLTPSRSNGIFDVADRADGDAGVERGRLQLRVTQQDLDHANVDALLKQMGGKAVPQGMRRHALGDSQRGLWRR